MKLNSRTLVLLCALSLVQSACGTNGSSTAASVDAASAVDAEKSAGVRQGDQYPGDMASEIRTSDCQSLDAGVIVASPGKFEMSGNGTIAGDAVIGPEGRVRLSGNAFVMGSLIKAKSVEVQVSGNSVIRGGVLEDAGDPASGVEDFATRMSHLQSTLRLENIDRSIVIKAQGRLNVIEVKDIRLSGNAAMVLSGGKDDVFVFNAKGKVSFSGNAAVLLDGEVDPGKVLFNALEGGSAIDVSGNAKVVGALLGLERGIKISGNSRIHGSMIAQKDIKISGNGFILDEVPFCSGLGGGGTDPEPTDPTPPAPTPAPTPVPPAPTPAPPAATPTPDSTPVPPQPTPVQPGPTPDMTPMPTPTPDATPVIPGDVTDDPDL